MMNAVADGVELPPLIVHYLIPDGEETGMFELNDGNHRWEAYSRLGIKNAYVIVWITDDHEYKQFMERFGEYVTDE